MRDRRLRPGLSRDDASGTSQRSTTPPRKFCRQFRKAKKDYRHDPNCRTAWELAWHLANTDVQFLDGIADGKFNMESPDDEHKPKTVADLVTWYDENMARGMERIRTMSSRATDRKRRFLRRVQSPGSVLPGIPEQPQHPSPRTTGHLPASHGSEVPVDLRRQLRRALDACRGVKRSLNDSNANRAARAGGSFVFGANMAGRYPSHLSGRTRPSGTSYLLNSRSAVSNVSRSSSACATSKRSNGSPWWGGRSKTLAAW